MVLSAPLGERVLGALIIRLTELFDVIFRCHGDVGPNDFGLPPDPLGTQGDRLVIG